MAQTFTYDCDNLSDIILHYQNASFRLHKLLLVRTSEYFQAALSSDALGSHDKCQQKNKCSTVGGQCITLSADKADEIGGVKVSAEELNQFFHHLYQMSDRTKELPQYTHSNLYPPHGYFTKIREIDDKTKEVKLDSYEYDTVNKIQAADLKLSDDSMVSSWPIGTLFPFLQLQITLTTRTTT